MSGMTEELKEMVVELIIKKRFCKGGDFRNEIEWLLENEDLPDEAVANAFRDAIYGTDELRPLDLYDHFDFLFSKSGHKSAIWSFNIVWRRMLYLLHEFDEDDMESEYKSLLDEN